MLELLIQQVVNGVSTGMAYALVALGLTLVFGVLHVINFAHGEFYMLGGLVTVVAVDTVGAPYAVALVAAAVGVAAFAWVVDLVAVRGVLEARSGHSTVLLSTFAISLIVFHSVVFGWGAIPHRVPGVEGTVSLGGVVITGHRLLLLAVGLALVIGLEYMLRRTRLGKEVRAVAQDAFGAAAVGLDVRKVRTSTYVIAGAVAALAGGLLTPIALFTPLMGSHVIIKAFVVVVVGGMGSVVGAVVCGIGLGVLEAVIGSFIDSGFALALIYSLLLVMLLVWPQGLFGRGR
ncbi:MAG: branched-chain amino acid ABC transporter permease [Isosphaeraceae bacterium]